MVVAIVATTASPTTTSMTLYSAWNGLDEPVFDETGCKPIQYQGKTLVMLDNFLTDGASYLRLSMRKPPSTRMPPSGPATIRSLRHRKPKKTTTPRPPKRTILLWPRFTMI